MSKINYVIIGNGTAGLSAAEEIRKNDADGNITIVTDEKHLTYYRIKLSEGISKEFSPKELYVHDEAWYRERNINVILDKSIEKIDTDNKKVIAEDGEEIEYDKLLIATGSRSFLPPIKGSEKTGVLALRSLNDLNEVRDYFKKCDKVTVLGGGLLGLEAAWAIKKLGKDVNVVEFSEQLLPRQLDEKISKKFSNILKEKELNLYLGVGAEEIIGDGEVEGVKLSDETILKTDSILISAGVRPRLELVETTDIEHDRGIKVDEFLETNIADVYAAGDVAEVEGMVVGLWGISGAQGKLAGKNMTGGKESYKLPELTTMLNIADNAIFSTGDIKNYDKAVEEEVKEDTNYKLCVTDGKITGGIIFNDMGKVPKVKKAIENKQDISKLIEKNMSASEIIKNI